MAGREFTRGYHVAISAAAGVLDRKGSDLHFCVVRQGERSERHQHGDAVEQSSN